jgi:putative transposase
VTDEAIALLAPRIGTRAACAASGVPQATWYRRHRASPDPPRPAPVPHRDRVRPRALAAAERQAILDMLHSARFADTAPAEAWATLLDEGTYLGSVSTYYRVLRAAGESRERRAQATHPAAVKPELATTGPNQEDVPAFVELESGGPPPVACQVVGVGQLPSHPTKEGDRREQHLSEECPPCRARPADGG